MSKSINVVAFNVPFPANYGGVIDVYYKLKSLKKEGYNIILHCFHYGREEQKELESLCQEVYYYKRKTGLWANLTFLPYIVQSRSNKALLNNLLKNDFPILFEGIHSCYFLAHSKLAKRLKIVRSHNIEHDYYYELFRNENNPLYKLYFLFESIRLKNFYPSLRRANQILAISKGDHDRLKLDFPSVKVDLVYGFHENNTIQIKTGKGEYAFYHGNLEVSENIKVAEFLIKEIAPNSSLPVIIAGLNPSDALKKLVAKTKNVTLKANVTETEMDELIKNAQVHFMFTYQDTGLKLKLMNTLFKGRFIIANDSMLDGMTFDDSVKLVKMNSAEIVKSIDGIKDLTFEQSNIERRSIPLVKFSNNVDFLKFRT